MSKHQYLISKYHWKSRESFIELSAIFRVFGFRCRVKNENAKLAENFLQHVYRKLHFPGFERRSH